MAEDKRVTPEVVEIDDFEFDDEFEDLFDQLGDILSTEAKETDTVELEEGLEEGEIVCIPNEPANQEVPVENPVLAKVTTKSDITSLAKSVFDAIQTMKQKQSVTVAENTVVKKGDTSRMTARNTFVYQPGNVTHDSYKHLKEKYKKAMKRHKKLKDTSHKGKKSKGHKISSDEYKRYKLMKQISLLDNALGRKRHQEAQEAEMQEKRARYRSEHTYPSSSRHGEEYWTDYVEPPTAIASFDLRNKLRSTVTRTIGTVKQRAYDRDHVKHDEPNRDLYVGDDPKLNKNKPRKTSDSEELKPSRDSGSSKVRNVCVSSSDDVPRKVEDLTKEEVEPVSSSTSVKQNVRSSVSRHSSISSCAEGEIITSMAAKKKPKKRKKKSKPESEKKSKTENKLTKINSTRNKSKTSCALSEETNIRTKSPQTYEVFDIAPFQSGNLDIEIISETITSHRVDTTICENVDQPKETMENITPLIDLDSPRRDSSGDSITSAKTIHRSRSVESIVSDEHETGEIVDIDIIKRSPSPTSPVRPGSQARSDARSLSEISDSSLGSLLLRRKTSAFASRKSSLHTIEELNYHRSLSPRNMNGRSPSSSPIRELSQSPRHRDKRQSSQRRSNEKRASSRDRKDERYYRRNSPTSRRVYRTSKSPPCNVPHYCSRDSTGTTSYYRKTRSRSPGYKLSRSPYRKRSRSRSREKYIPPRPPYRKRSRSKSPYRRRISRSPYRKRSSSPCKVQKSRSPYIRPLRSRSPYQRSFSPPRRKTRRSKSPLQKRFEAAVANFLPQHGKKASVAPKAPAEALLGGYAANTGSFTMTATTVQQVYSQDPSLEHTDHYSRSLPQQPVPYSPVAPFPAFNKWTPPPGPIQPPMLEMPYAHGCQMPLHPPGVLPYTNTEQPSMPPGQNMFPLPPPQNISFPVPVPLPPQPSTILHPHAIPPPLVQAAQLTLPVISSLPSTNVIGTPDLGGHVNTPIEDTQSTCATSHIVTIGDKQLDFYSNSPSNNPLKNQSSFSSKALAADSFSIRTDVSESMSESISDGSTAKQSTGSSNNREKHSPIILRLKKHFQTLIASKSTEIGTHNQTPTVGDLNFPSTVNQQALDKLIPTNSENPSNSLAIPVVRTVSKVVKKISFPVKENDPNITQSNLAHKASDITESGELPSLNNNAPSTCAVDKLNDAIAIHVTSSSLHRASSNFSNRTKNVPISSNRIVIDASDFPSQTANKQEMVQTNKSQVVQQVIKLLSISKRTACTQVDFIDNTLQGSDEVFEVKTSDHEDLLRNLTRLLN